MGISNEQRAHDIAIEYGKMLYDAALRDAHSGEKVSFDFYSEYKHAYEMVIELIEKDFK
ncbi:hypothetical protein [Proteiniclasticum sp. QWL-01]|uniref:hypothetical protein n=1 Tax=Proteiniclasticum sp. QWL-01 TaxID=3036945 RepID=UPI002410DE31|nr:hypothetical protein [Proteiniclasticum sp. QWL-01]WFF73981.1 hypothetical protein P6M73_05910 [Proteiniclasticum sp. QWL-01]